MFRTAWFTALCICWALACSSNHLGALRLREQSLERLDDGLGPDGLGGPDGPDGPDDGLGLEGLEGLDGVGEFAHVVVSIGEMKVPGVVSCSSFACSNFDSVVPYVGGVVHDDANVEHVADGEDGIVHEVRVPLFSLDQLGRVVQSVVCDLHGSSDDLFAKLCHRHLDPPLAKHVHSTMEQTVSVRFHRDDYERGKGGSGVGVGRHGWVKNDVTGESRAVKNTFFWGGNKMAEEKSASPRRHSSPSYPSMQSRFVALPQDVVNVVKEYAPSSFRNYRGTQIELALRTILQYGEMVMLLFEGTDVSDVTCTYDFGLQSGDAQYHEEQMEAPFNPNLFTSAYQTAMHHVTTSSSLLLFEMNYDIPPGHEVLDRLDANGGIHPRVWAVHTVVGIDEDKFECDISIAFLQEGQ